ncbi:hypothetical protein LCGC14_1806450 [marine sediment metagenome]|uniref:Uncharacterized protein n=1 Tax=marine sediment metagenome TaxID=412755 RepID=A0A0F9JMS0_9ZZZZ
MSEELEVAQISALAITLSELAAKTQVAASDALWVFPQVAADQNRAIILAIASIDIIRESQINARLKADR